MIVSDEEWVSFCKLDDENEICFTDEYLEIMSDIGGNARSFVSQLISDWGDENKTLLDYFGNPDLEEDEYDGIDGNPMDIREDKMDLLEYYGKPIDGLEAEWFRDVLRAKLLTMKLPKRVLAEYVKVAKKELFGGL